MAGLRDRFVTIKFPELTEDGQPDLYVTFRNPKLVPLDWMASKVATDAAGRPVDDDAATRDMYEKIARLITGFRMFDSADMGEDQAMLEMPITADKVARFPGAVNSQIAEELARLNASPTTTPDSPTS